MIVTLQPHKGFLHTQMRKRLYWDMFSKVAAHVSNVFFKSDGSAFTFDTISLLLATVVDYYLCVYVMFLGSANVAYVTNA